MPSKVTLEIDIAPSGETKVHIKGMKGKSCEKVVDLFKDFLGDVKEMKRTSEYYEPDRDGTISTRF